jgi:hypothetical protein
LVLEAQAVTECTELQAEAAEAAEQAEAVLAEAELEAHKLLITVVALEEMERAQAEAETTINQESATREVLA